MQASKRKKTILMAYSNYKASFIFYLLYYRFTYLFHAYYVPSLLIGNVEPNQRCVIAQR